ncbi:MAG: glycoside hydrolase family 3 C-terminal domain-containing protein [Bacilli bacterium]
MSIKKRRRLYAGGTAICASLLSIMLVGSIIANENASTINDQLHVQTTKPVTDDSEEEVDSQYYKSSYGDGTFSDANWKELRKATIEQTKNEMREGAVLLFNQNNALSLTSEKSVTVLGHASVDPCYKASSAGNKVKATSPDVINLKSALETDGLTVNPEAWTALEGGKAARGELKESWGGMALAASGSAKGSEENSAFYNDLTSSFATSYKDACIITIAREGAEGTDMIMDDSDDEGGATGKISSLALHKNEKDLLSYAKANFSKVVVLLNSPYQMEVEEIKDYASAILYIGEPGLTGFAGVADILVGKTNPSGRLVDTYAENSLSAPAVVNSGTRTPEFLNADAIDSEIGSEENARWMSFQAENIYVGYKYYETRYEDQILSRNNATDNAGSKDSSAWDYASEMSYTFGYGLSYTTFSQTLESVNVGDNEITVKVKVKNTGSVAGKEVVQVYAQTPYSKYEQDNGIEKSAIQIVGYGKTKSLAKSEEEIVSVTIDKYLLASYDEKGAKGYILSGGDNYIAIGDDAHDALNNILKAKNASNLVDAEGTSVAGDSSKAYKFTTSLDTNKYQKSSNGVIVTNRFEDCDLNSWIDNSGTYLSRSDWKGTYPTKQTQVTATSDMMKALSGNTYKKSETASKASDVELGVDQGLSLVSMKDVDYDSSLWDDFVKQLTLDEMAPATAESFSCLGINKISQAAFGVGDGMDSTGGTFIYTDKTTCPSMTYTSKPILTGTFNNDLYAKRGELMGEEAMFTGYMENYNIGADLHRTPFGGRNFEYMSEDAILSYLVSIPETEAMEKKGTHAAAKHFCGNDQETHREGVTTFFNEQAFRENDLKAFEGSLRVGKAGGLMQSFERQGCTWTSANYSLNTTVLRNEWGFTGNVVTDATASASKGYKSHVVECLDAGTQQFCLDFSVYAGTTIVQQIKDTDDGDLLAKLMQATKDWEYAICHTTVINGYTSKTRTIQVTPWWKTTLIAIDSVLGVMTAGAVALTVVSNVKKEGN